MLVVAAHSHMHVMEKQEMEGIKTCWEKAGEALLSHWYQDLRGSTSEQEPAGGAEAVGLNAGACSRPVKATADLVVGQPPGTPKKEKFHRNFQSLRTPRFLC